MTIGTIELIQGLLIAFLLVVVLMPPYIRFARSIRFGKHIREEGPQSHYLKEGTPTGAGILIVLVVAAVAILLGAVGADTPDTYSPLAGPARRRRAGRRRRLPERPDRRRASGPATS